jgi:hypothetical protein
MPVPLRSDFDALQLRMIARKTKDGRQARRLLALVLTVSSIQLAYSRLWETCSD